MHENCYHHIGKRPDCSLDSRFGTMHQSFWSMIWTIKTFEIIDNQQNLNAAQGAGIQSAETVVRSGAKVLVSGHCGPKAFRVLAAAGVKVYSMRRPDGRRRPGEIQGGKVEGIRRR